MTIYFCLWSQLPTVITIWELNQKYWNTLRISSASMAAGDTMVFIAFSDSHLPLWSFLPLSPFSLDHSPIWPLLTTPFSPLLTSLGSIRLCQMHRGTSCDWQWDQVRSPPVCLFADGVKTTQLPCMTDLSDWFAQRGLFYLWLMRKQTR